MYICFFTIYMIALIVGIVNIGFIISSSITKTTQISKIINPKLINERIVNIILESNNIKSIYIAMFCFSFYSHTDTPT